MNYIISEGEKGKAECKFWNIITKYLNLKTEIVCCGGIRNVCKELNNLYTETDKFYLAIDNVFNTGVRRLTDKYTDVSNVIFSEYICFEEIFLSFSRLKEYIVVDSEEQKILYQIQELIFKDIETAKILAHQIGNINTNNIEKFISCVLSRITSKNQGLHVCKSNLGECWFTDCSIHKQSLHKFDCKKCGISEKYLTLNQKYNELEENSLLCVEASKLKKFFDSGNELMMCTSCFDNF